MARETVKEKVVIDQKIGKETTQILLEGDIIVPDVKPDMSVLLQTEAKISVDKAEQSNERVNFMGRLDIQVLYLAKASENPIHSMSATTTIDDFVNMEGLTKDMWTDVKMDIANMEYKVINDRKINYRAVVDVNVTAETSQSHDIVVDISEVPSNQLQKTVLNLNRRIETLNEKFIAKDEFQIPSGKPNIREILLNSMDISNKDVRVGNGKVNINGEIVLTTLYRGDNENSIIDFAELEIPFNANFEMPNVRDDMLADVNLSIADQYIQVRQDEDGEDRVIEVEVSVNAMLKISCQDALEILEDAYCINQNLEICKTPIRYPKLICHNKNQTPIKEIVTLQENCPDILQIFKANGTPYVHEARIIDDKVVVEGAIDATVMYVAQSDESPFYSYNCMIPFMQVIETKGAKENMDVSMDLSLDHISFNMLSGRDMELRFLLSFNTNVIEELEANIISDIEFNEMDKTQLNNMPGMTIYVVQNHDNLWKIAKNYNTSIDELLAVNEVENPNKIYPGQKLLILKKVCVD